MPIAKQTREEFLARKLESCEWMKKLDEPHIDRMLAKLDPQPKFHTTPYLHQKAVFLIGLHYPQYLPLLDMGLGKSKIVLDLIAYRKRLGQFKKALVCVPNVANIEGWLTEVETHAPQLKAMGLFGSTKDRRELIQFSEGVDLYIINYAGLVHLVSDRIPKPGRQRGGALKPSRKIAGGFIDSFDTLILDESTAVRHKRTLTFRVISFLSSMCQVRYALTGTPFGRDPQDLWGQFYCIDRGATLGPSLGIFRECFFAEKPNYFGGTEYKFDTALKGLFHKVLQHRSISYSSDELPYLNFPPAVYAKRMVRMTPEVEHIYKTGVQNLRQAAKLGQRIQIERHFMQLRQLASGFLYHGGEENAQGVIKNREIVNFSPNPKIEALMELFESMPPTAKLIIFNEFIHSGDLIAAAFKEAGIGYARLYSGTKNPGEEVKGFTTKNECRVGIINSQSGAFGLNLQVANYVVFYESPVSPIIRQQAERRCRRIGQKASRVFYYDLIARGSVEERILGFLKEGKNLFQALIKGKATL